MRRKSTKGASQVRQRPQRRQTPVDGGGLQAALNEMRLVGQGQLICCPATVGQEHLCRCIDCRDADEGLEVSQVLAVGFDGSRISP